MRSISKKILTILFFVVVALILSLSLRGRAGNPTAEVLNSPYWKDAGPLELSPDRGRFALTYSLVEDKSFYFSLPIARFATPDLGYKDGHYVSLFAPGVSYLIIPGYMIGKLFGLSQVGSFAAIAFFALLNAILIKNIAQKIGAKPVASNLAAMAFLFGTPAFTYAVTLYQHHISAFLFLMPIWLLLKFKGLKVLFLVWFLLAASVLVDYPNIIFALPVGVFALGRMFNFEFNKSIKIDFKMLGIITFVSILLPLGVLMGTNYVSYQNPLQLAGTVSSVKAIDAQGRPTAPEVLGNDSADQFLYPDSQKKSAVGFFQTRHILQGFFIHIFSPDRGILVYAPVILFGVLGLILLYKTQPQMTALLTSIIMFNLLLYSMWDDPWGGWAFGSRYLIISYAFLAIGIAIFLTQMRKKYFAIGLFALVLTYSALVNTLGAITSSKNPPKAEILDLESKTGREEKYTFARNSVFLLENGSKSFVYQTYLSRLFSPVQFYLGLSAFIVLLSLSQITLLQLEGATEKQTKEARVLKKRRARVAYATA